jgi:hypothetical protein
MKSTLTLFFLDSAFLVSPFISFGRTRSLHPCTFKTYPTSGRPHIDISNALLCRRNRSPLRRRDPGILRRPAPAAQSRLRLSAQPHILPLVALHQVHLAAGLDGIGPPARHSRFSRSVPLSRSFAYRLHWFCSIVIRHSSQFHY